MAKILMKFIYNIKEKEKEKDKSQLSNSRGKKPINNNKINIKRVNNMNGYKNNYKANMMKKEKEELNKAFDNKSKGNSPPLFSKINKNNILNPQNQKPLKTIKIVGKSNKVDTNLNKSSKIRSLK